MIGNGGVLTPEAAFDMVRHTNVDGIMIGRGAVGNPWIFKSIHEMAEGRPAPSHTMEERRAVLLDHFEQLIRLNRKHPRHRKASRRPPEDGAALHFRGHLVRYLSGTPGWPAVRRTLQTINTPDAVRKAVDQALHPSLDSHPVSG